MASVTVSVPIEYLPQGTYLLTGRVTTDSATLVITPTGSNEEA